MKDFDLRNLDFNNAGAWPVPVKSFFCVLAVVVIGALGWYFLHADQKTQLEGLQAQELTLRQEFEFKQGKAANLEALKQQLEEMEVMLFQMLRQLPSKTEMPDLIVDISQTALSTGISNELFQPGAEVRRDFYAEKPIQLRMIGTYHQFGAFVSGVASLPRVVIMTMSDISLRPRNAPGASANELMLEGTIKTYRYLDENETGGAQ
ncbi:type 4a pilus biogenesis protein PilO [Pseudomarimonas arenosa]|uniref:Type 4a pilus biogenesis protein PilO n=1 Tax=Pseudomarimonas arenosa TaxID=2774145 RepID=A0AAW3ZK03_9GAMM|nr:type 4a pilus biogenesis protein PilO [Pseudomarimonas arenosa]MBD8525022.1 type 4a pilus biogenesis protein PilO [Pseudomarimonas arenosa]